ncbi:MAG: biopolymer transporter ExbD [Bdellovibrionales bacterium]|nr:biopolymer transporter ExbD [Bdellovibrionales bacterium]
MIGRSIIKETALCSPIGASSTLSPKGGMVKRHLAAGVTLTSLVDAFSILVIYLLVSFAESGEVLYIAKDMELPTANQSAPLERATVVKLESGKIYIEDKEIEPSSLMEALVDVRKQLAAMHGDAEGFEPALTVQADRRAYYKELNQIVHASAQSGFNEVRFAVLAP